MKRLICSAVCTILCLCATVLASAETRGIMLRNGGSLKKQTNLGMEWAAEIPVGTEFEVLSQTPVKADWVWKGGSSKDRTFYKVRYQGKDYFVLTNECAVIEQGVGVITSDAVLYDKGRVSSFRNAVLERGTLVAFTGATATVMKTHLYLIKFYDASASVVRERWVWEEKISMKKDNVKAAQLVKLAQTVKDDDMKREYLSLASGLPVSSPIREYISDAESLLFPPPMTIVNLPESKFASVVCEDGDKVNVRSAPKTGEVVGQLSEGDSGLVDMSTEEEDTIDDVTSRWYHVNATVDGKEISGWVFGGFLQFGGN